MHKGRDRLAICAFLVVVLTLWMVFFLMPQPRVAPLPTGETGYDLTGCDLTDTVYTDAHRWESWPQRLYTPADFEYGLVAEAPVRLTDADYRTVDYVTHRLSITLPAGGLYALDMRTSDFSMRLYINGEEVDSVGTPSNAWETTQPQVMEKTYLLTPRGETVTLLVHAANFVHSKAGCQPPVLTLGTPENIARLTTQKTAFNFAVASSLVTAFLYHLGLFLLGQRRVNALYLALCCALFVVMTKTPVLAFVPHYSFYVWIRVEYMVMLLIFVTLTLFLRSVFPDLYRKWVLVGFYAISGLYAPLILFGDTVFFTGLLIYYEIAGVAVILYTILRLALRLRGGGGQNLLAFVGVLAVSLSGLWDIGHYHGVEIGSRFLGQYFITPMGMIVFVFCYAMVVSLEYAEAERRQQQLAADNASLDRLSQLKSDLMVTISHEARTPLAVLSSYAGLVSMQLRDKGMEPQIAADLDKVVSEAKRVANLIDSMGKLALPGGDVLRRVPLDICDVARQTAELYRHILERAGVALTLHAEPNLPPVLGSPEELTQVLLNLLQNAKNATERGRVTITIGHSGGRVAVTVSDTGTGIAPEALPRVFQRGFSLCGGLGVGLPLCKEIAESHGGDITLSSAQGVGTAVTLTLPVCPAAGGVFA